MEALVILDLRKLEAGMPGLTPAFGRVQAEAAAVCLENQRHREPVVLSVRKVATPGYLLRWPELTETMRRAFNDLERATELGAYGIAILLVKEQTGLAVVWQSKKGTGFDYWLGPVGADDELVFQNSARLEVSGILTGTERQFLARVKQKLKQTKASDETGLPAYAVVVEFGCPQVEVAKR